MGFITDALCKVVAFLNWFGDWLPQLGLRLLLAWEFWESGVVKYRGENWFADIQEKFPYPFNQVPVDVSWTLATWTELAGAVLLVLGLGTRFASFSLLILTVVATAAVHWPQEWNNLSDLLQGYAITDKGFGNFKLPLIFMVMLLPLLFRGPGRLSLDSIVCKRFCGDCR
jgi:putative oxidoreductase